ncbi:MAG: thioesterase [Rhodothermales bacterium]
MSHPTDPRIWRESFRVRAYEAGPDQRLTIASLCNYLQEVAGNHAQALGVSVTQQPGLTWMLNRLHVRIDRLPVWGDTVTVDTWPSGHNGLLAWREFLVRDGNGALLVAGASAWVMIDIERRRPIRLPAFIDAIPLPDAERPIADPFPKRVPPPVATHAAAFTVYPGDLDPNGHANNVCFAGWALHALPPQAGALRSLEIDFKAEAHLGDRIVSEAAPSGESAFAHGLYREEDGGRRLIGVARTTFG